MTNYKQLELQLGQNIITEPEIDDLRIDRPTEQEKNYGAQYLLFNEPTSIKEVGEKDFRRRRKEKPDINGLLTCLFCKNKKPPSEIIKYLDIDTVQKEVYDGKNAQETQRVLNVADQSLKSIVDKLKELKSEVLLLQREYNSSGENQDAGVRDVRRILELINDHSDAATRYRNAVKEAVSFIKKVIISDKVPFQLFPPTLDAEPYREYLDYTFGPFKLTHIGFAGNVLEAIDRQIASFNKKREIIIAYEPEDEATLTYNVSILKPLCKKCFNEITIECADCGKKFYKWSDFKRTDNGTICSSCYSEYIPCDGCYATVSENEINVTDIGDRLCEGCYFDYQKTRQDGYDVTKFVKAYENIQYSNPETYLPIDYKLLKPLLEQVILPMKNLKVVNLDSISDKIERAALPKDSKSQLIKFIKNLVLDNSVYNYFYNKEQQNVNISGLISALEKYINNNNKYQEQGFNKPLNLPFSVFIESEGDRDVPSFVIKIKPSDKLINYANDLFSKNVADKALYALVAGGHHYGYIAYARIGYDESNNIFIVNNLQTDADAQSVTGLSTTTTEIKEAIKWWLKVFQNWPEYLLTLIRDIGKKLGTKIYITGFDIQQRKWQHAGLPNRSRDLYEKIPRQLNMKNEDIYAKVETLGYDNYKLYRVARQSRMSKIANMLLTDILK